MKQIMLALLGLLAVSVASAKERPLSIVSGDKSVLSSPAEAKLVIDFSEAKIDSRTIDEYFADKGGNQASQWSVLKPNIAVRFADKFNKKNSKGLQLLTEDKSVKYTMKITINTVDPGNYIPLIKEEGAKISGLIELVDNETGEVKLTMRLARYQGRTNLSDVVRVIEAFADLPVAILKAK